MPTVGRRGLPRPHHSEEIRRQGILGLGALADRDQAVDPLLRLGGDGDGAAARGDGDAGHRGRLDRVGAGHQALEAAGERALEEALVVHQRRQVAPLSKDAQHGWPRERRARIRA